MIPPKLAWVPTLVTVINHATDGDIVGTDIEDVADPLKKLVVLKLGKDWCGKNYKPFQLIAHAFAKANNCVLERIRHRPGAFVLEVLIKRRLGPESKKNPMGWGDKDEDRNTFAKEKTCPTTSKDGTT